MLQQSFDMIEFIKPISRALYGRVRLVGGCVRDSLKGLPIHDIDVATQLTPDEVITCLKHAGISYKLHGVSHGTVMAIIGETAIEITTLRQDIKTDGRHAEVMFTRAFKQDSNRRDFTINALYMGSTGKVYDYHGGRADLKQGIVRFIGSPQKRIHEDGLRIFRFFRFFAHYGNGSPDNDAMVAIAKNRHMLHYIAHERITYEVLKMMDAKNPLPALNAMDKTGVWQDLFNAPYHPITINDDGYGGKSLRRLYALLPGNVLNSSHLKLSRAQKAHLKTIAKVDLSHPRKSTYFYGADAVRDAFLLAGKNPPAINLPPFPLGGDDLKGLGVKEGYLLGYLLNKTLDWWLSHDVPPDKETCMDHVKTLAKSLLADNKTDISL